MTAGRLVARVVVGVGMSSNATTDEVRELVERALGDRGFELSDVLSIVTRHRFCDDPRLRLGPPLMGVADADLEAASRPCHRATGIRAHVAETAALLAAGLQSPADLIGLVERSAHVTVAVATVDLARSP